MTIKQLAERIRQQGGPSRSWECREQGLQAVSPGAVAWNPYGPYYHVGLDPSDAAERLGWSAPLYGWSAVIPAEFVALVASREMHLNGRSDACLPYGALERECAIEYRAQISAYASEAQIEAYSTYQVQCLRRIVHGRRTMPWRESQLLADRLDLITQRVLVARGAWTKRRHDEEQGEARAQPEAVAG